MVTMMIRMRMLAVEGLSRCKNHDTISPDLHTSMIGSKMRLVWPLSNKPRD
jgi:hypothetical protein